MSLVMSLGIREVRRYALPSALVVPESGGPGPGALDLPAPPPRPGPLRCRSPTRARTAPAVRLLRRRRLKPAYPDDHGARHLWDHRRADDLAVVATESVQLGPRGVQLLLGPIPLERQQLAALPTQRQGPRGEPV